MNSTKGIKDKFYNHSYLFVLIDLQYKCNTKKE